MDLPHHLQDANSASRRIVALNEHHPFGNLKTIPPTYSPGKNIEINDIA